MSWISDNFFELNGKLIHEKYKDCITFPDNFFIKILSCLKKKKNTLARKIYAILADLQTICKKENLQQKLNDAQIDELRYKALPTLCVRECSWGIYLATFD